MTPEEIYHYAVLMSAQCHGGPRAWFMGTASVPNAARKEATTSLLTQGYLEHAPAPACFGITTSGYALLWKLTVTLWQWKSTSPR
jgi:hypothetical protein